MKKRSFLEAIAILLGITIGAGILGIPNVVSKSGFFIGLIHLIILGLAILTLNLYVGEIALRTKTHHQLTGYAELYLGKVGKRIMSLSMVIGIYGALIAYLIGEGEALFAIFNINSPVVFTLIFFALASLPIFLGLKTVGRSELLMSVILILIILTVSLLSIPYSKLSNLAYSSVPNFFLPYGVILFAFIGAAAIPEMKEELKNNKKLLKKAIIIGSLIPLIIYVLFTLVVVSVTGIDTTEISTIGLGKLIGRHMILLGNLFAVFSMATSFIGLGLALKWVYNFDYKINKTLSFLLTVSVPLIIVLLKITTFTQILQITGAFAGGIDGILITMMYWKAKKLGKRKPEYVIHENKFVSYLIILLFILGIVYTAYTLLI